MELPISRKQAVQASQWLKDNFGAKINAAVQGTVFTIDHVCGIACQETAYRWLGWLDDGLSTRDILGACVLDGSGDVKDTDRSAFPVNTAAFRKEYGDSFTNLLIAEGNKMRKLMGWGPVNWIYKGYGIFQFDLQFVKEDEAYFRERKWHDFDVCLSMLMGELKTTWAWVQANHADKPKAERIRLAIRKYNGAGARAEAYSHNVMFFTEAASEATGAGGPGGGTAPVISVTSPKITGIDFEMELGSGDSLRTGHLIVMGENRAVLLHADATSGMLGHQDAGNLWEVSNGPIPSVDGLTIQTREVIPESNGQKGSRFSILPTYLKKPGSDVERAGFNIRAGSGNAGTGGSIAIKNPADFETFRSLMAGAAAAGVGEISIRVLYSGAMLDLTKAAVKKLGAVFTLALKESDEMIYGRFVITGNAGEELYSARATSGQRTYQHPGEFWTVGKGVVPPAGMARFIETKVFKTDAPMGTRYRILPEEVSNPAGTVTRSAFRVHFDGGSPGSAGCIVFPSTSDYTRLIAVFAALKEKGVEKLPLTLSYA